MQDTLFQNYSPSQASNHECAENISLILNTAFIRTKAATTERDLAGELAALSKTPAYQAISHASQRLAQSENISELEAAEELIKTFRKLEEVWSSYLCQEGLAQLTSEE